METHFIRRYKPSDEKQIIDICYQTGFLGETLEEKNRFQDKYLFALLFCLYYLWFEPENCFVCEAADGKICGYVIGTMNTERQHKQLVSRMAPKIMGRAICHTLFKEPKDVATCIQFILTLRKGFGKKGFEREYPAHLHINVGPEYQKIGAGGQLLEAFEEWACSNKVLGIHLMTTDLNIKAVPFYVKHGYFLLGEKLGEGWDGVPPYKELLMAKAIGKKLG